MTDALSPEVMKLATETAKAMLGDMWRKADVDIIARALTADRASCQARVEELERALRGAETAIAEFYRYWTGGEMRGSYDGKPERDALWKAMHAARTVLARSALEGK